MEEVAFFSVHFKLEEKSTFVNFFDKSPFAMPKIQENKRGSAKI
jgi:hypothetical protein